MLRLNNASRRVAGALLLSIAAVSFCWPEAAALPAGFEDEGLLDLEKPVDFAFAPPSTDSKIMFLVTKRGYLHTYDLESGEEQVALDMSGYVL